MQTILVETAKSVDTLKNSTNPFVQYLHRIFTEPITLYRILTDSVEGCKLYTYADITFAVPNDIDIDLPYRTASLSHGSAYQNTAKEYVHRESEKHEEPIKRPYGSSWFSQKAHNNMNALTKEYHQLAKKYHPDICNHSQSQAMFQEILNERAEILESLAK